MLLYAELRKLARPLLWGTALAAVAFFVLLLWGASNNAKAGMTDVRSTVACDVSPTPQCQAAAAASAAAGRRDAQGTRRQEQPGAVGQVAAGMMASLPGVVVVALLAGAHVAGEWSGRTIRAVLTHQGHRLRVMAAKWLSLWLAVVAIMALCWVVLALVGPALAALAGLPGGGGSWAGLGASVSQFLRASLVLGLFCLIGVAAGVLTRNPVATIALVVGLMVVFLILGGVQSLATASPATSVQAWMHFQFNGTYLPTNFWSRFERSGVTVSTAAGLVGILLTGAVAAAATVLRARADVTV